MEVRERMKLIMPEHEPFPIDPAMEQLRREVMDWFYRTCAEQGWAPGQDARLELRDMRHNDDGSVTAVWGISPGWRFRPGAPSD